MSRHRADSATVSGKTGRRVRKTAQPANAPGRQSTEMTSTTGLPKTDERPGAPKNKKQGDTPCFS